MSFSGKATYTAGAALPELAEDVSDLVAINSPHETPLLDALGDPARMARSTVHEWLEDRLLPTSTVITDVISGTEIEVGDTLPFQVGDQLRVAGGAEVLLVTAVDVNNSTITITRNYGGTPGITLAADQVVHVIGNAALEGGDAATARFLTRSRIQNYTQIFSATVDVSGSELAVRQIGVRDELDYQKNQRTRELLRDVENSVINGVAAGANPEGAAAIRRTMRGLSSFIQTNRFTPGSDFPSDTTLTEEQLNLALRNIWTISSGHVDLIVVGGAEKRAINEFVSTNRRFSAGGEDFKSLINVYESDYGVCRVVLSRNVPAGTVLLLDSSRIEVMPLAGRSFHYKPLASTGDRESGMVVGEYTLEFRNESAHGMITGLGG